MPGSEKITSVTIAPLIRAPSWSPRKVTVGMSAFGRDVALEDRLSLIPFVRAVLMKSSRRTPTALARTKRTSGGPR